MKKLLIICLVLIPYFGLVAQDTDYYEYSHVQTGIGVENNGHVNGEDTVFALKDGEIEVFIKVSQDTALSLTELNYEVYSGNEYNDFEFEKSLEIGDKEWSYVYFSINFFKPGSYVVDMYNQEYAFINTAYIVITE
jgi:hypothetical protein